MRTVRWMLALGLGGTVAGCGEGALPRGVTGGVTGA